MFKMFVLILARLKYDTGVSDNFVRLSRLLFGADKCFQAAFPEKLVITKTFHLTRKGFFFFYVFVSMTLTVVACYRFEACS